MSEDFSYPEAAIIQPASSATADDGSAMREMISNRPHWLIRNGNLILLFIVGLILAFTWFVRYPDVIKGSMRLVAVNAPKILVAKTEGKLERLLVANESVVFKGQPLAFIESTGDPVQMLHLHNWVDSMVEFLENDSMDALFRNPLPVCNDLGDVQPNYQQFESAFQESLQVLANGYYQRKKRALKEDLAFLSELRDSRLRQQQLTR